MQPNRGAPQLQKVAQNSTRFAGPGVQTAALDDCLLGALAGRRGGGTRAALRRPLRRRLDEVARRRPSLGTSGPRDLQSGGVHARADVAQLAEHITRNDGVPGSIPGVGSKHFSVRPRMSCSLSALCERSFWSRRVGSATHPTVLAVLLLRRTAATSCARRRHPGGDRRSAGEDPPPVAVEHLDQPRPVERVRGHPVAAGHRLGLQHGVQDRFRGRFDHGLEERGDEAE